MQNVSTSVKDIEKKKKKYKIIGLSPVSFLVIFAVVIVCMYLDVLPAGITGGLAVVIPLAAILSEIGKRLPIIRSYFGGSAFVALFGSSLLVYLHVLPTTTIKAVSDFTGDPINFLNYGIVVLIAGSLLGLDRGSLRAAIVRYLPCIIACQAAAIVAVYVVAWIIGFNPTEAMFFVALPVLGGGIGAGAIPMSQMISSTWHTSSSALLAEMSSSIALANAFAIIFGGLMNRLGKVKSSWSGDGKLIARGKLEIQDVEMESKTDDYQKLGVGILVSVIFMCVGTLLNHFVPLIHEFAWMIILCCILKLSGKLPTYIEEACYNWQQLFIKNFGNVILVCLGVSEVKMADVLNAVTSTRVILILAAVVGGCVAAMAMGKLLGFYPIEAGITTGLCSTDMGGTGDLAILGAAHRMELLPYSAISTRIGGAVILILSGILARIFIMS
ncbi:MAG: 2-hydroxycarboxylate transporter family protein [Lactobacillus sp.]|jgi:Na+/citrate or Na+/malate symporter|nr:2-hydroxycarboxylate transporter family protein [Lactobacillus sp.]MCI2031878.1 2-hydroxycarboxylate transporter family protein [Lactobacillus sp.]